jgi:hypothetical protein
VRHCNRQAGKAISRQWLATRSLYFALDGAAPAAKLILQRARRQEDAESLRRDLLFYGVRESSASSIELTPGTELMQTVGDALTYAACSHLVRASTRLRAPRVAVFVDGSGVAGEGEGKIFAHILAHARDGERSLVISGDSDVLLCGLLSSRRHIDILSTNGVKAGESVGYSVDALRREIGLFFGCTHDGALARVVDDFCLFSLLLGSDFTPALQHYNFLDTLLAYRTMRAGSPNRFVYDRDADSIDVDALLQCLVAKSVHAAFDDSRRWSMFAERFGSLVPDSDTRPTNVESFLYGIQWSLRYLGDDGADDRYFCKQQASIALEDIVAWAAATRTRHTAPIARIQNAPLLAASALVAVCPVRYGELVPPVLRALHREVSAELDVAIAATLKLPGVDVSPVTKVLESLNGRVQSAAMAALKASAGDVEAAKANSLLRNVTKHATVGHFERDETGKHMFAWPRQPRALPEVKTRTGIMHKRIDNPFNLKVESAA